MDKNQKFVSELLADLQRRLESTENGFHKRILKRLVAVVEEYIVENELS